MEVVPSIFQLVESFVAYFGWGRLGLSIVWKFTVYLGGRRKPKLGKTLRPTLQINGPLVFVTQKDRFPGSTKLSSFFELIQGGSSFHYM